MDYHLKFRMDSMKHSSQILGNGGQGRLPSSGTPLLFRPKCKPVPLSENEQGISASPAKEPETNLPEASTGRSDNAQVRQQVKQLQFWLKVFSRFCQDDRSRD